MKKGIVIGVSVGAGIIAIATGIILLVMNATKFRPREDGFILTETNYGQFTTACEIDATFSEQMANANMMKYETIKPFKTGQYTQDGFPIWAVGQRVKGIGDHPDVSYLCRLGTDEDSAYLINLYINNQIVKTYNTEVQFLNEKGEPF